MSDRGVQSCGSCLHLSKLFLGSRRAGSDSTISWSANTWFSMKLKSMITTSLFHLFLVWHVEPKARRKQVGQHGFHQGACHAVSLFRVWAFGCLNEEETWQPGFVGPRHLATPFGKPEAFGNLVHSGRLVQVRLGPFRRFWSVPHLWHFFLTRPCCLLADRRATFPRLAAWHQWSAPHPGGKAWAGWTTCRSWSSLRRVYLG